LTGRVIPFRSPPAGAPEAEAQAARILSLDPETRGSLAVELHLDDAEILLVLCGLLRKQLEANPARTRADAEFFYEFVLGSEKPIGLFDEREYFLGEMALLAGSASRMLFRREEASRWFDRSESAFRHTVNAVADWARVSYQRLALRLEDREFEQVLELLPSLSETFRKLGMRDDALKCRFLEGIAYTNTERFDEALELFRDVSAEAGRLGNESLLAVAGNNLVQLHGILGNSNEALESARQTLTVFQKVGHRVGLAKLQWGIGTLMRTQGNLPAALEAYGTARDGFIELEMPSDVAALSLVLADVLLETGDESAAHREILRALPIIQSQGMVPEGFAALSLLQESVRQKHVDRAALRQLHGYFEELSQRS
jgi:tetratricopeptide (TPR) repeat protein